MTLSQWLSDPMPPSKPKPPRLENMIVAIAATRDPKGKGDTIYWETPVVLHRPGSEACLPTWRTGERGVTRAVSRALRSRDLVAWCKSCW
jgi:hypothetical protein